MNMYAYVGNDPINGTDPSGLAWDDEIVVHGTRHRQTYDPPPGGFGGGFGGFGAFAGAGFSGGNQIADHTKDTVDKSLCGSRGAFSSNWNSTAKNILPDGTPEEISQLTIALSQGYSRSADRVESFYGSSITNRAYGESSFRPFDAGMYIARTGGLFGPEQITLIGKAGINPPLHGPLESNATAPGNLVAIVVAPNVRATGSRNPYSRDNYADRIADRSKSYNLAASRSDVPVVVGTPFGICTYKG